MRGLNLKPRAHLQAPTYSAHARAYKKLADRFKLQVATVQHMVKYLQTTPEVIAWISIQYTPVAIPDWVGKLEGVTDYREAT